MYSHLGAARHVIKRLPSTLHVIAVVFNPLRFQSRYNLFRDFERHAHANPEVELKVVELAFGDRPFEVTSPDNPDHWQIRTNQELWHKERMINIAVSRLLPSDWEYVAWVDADVTFVNPDWAHETMQQLQHYQVVQMFTHAIDIGPNMEPLDSFEGFAYQHVKGQRFFPTLAGVKKGGSGYDYYSARYWHPGYGWAYRREAWNALGGMLDINIVGGGDHQMAYGLIGRIEETIPGGTTDQYTKTIRNWGEKAALLKRNVGAVPGTVMHHFHGKKADRGYYNRWRILSDNKFDPLVDLKPDWQQMWALAGNKIKLRDDLRAYFRARNEDSTV
jgi:hypothetical protein